MSTTAGVSRKLRSSTTAKRSSSENTASREMSSTGLNRAQPAAKKRPALANITNQRPFISTRTTSAAAGSSVIVPCSTKIVTIKKTAPPISISKAPYSGSSQSVVSSFAKQNIAASSKNAFSQKSDVIFPPIDVPLAPKAMDLSPSAYDGHSVSMDESMSTCDSLKSPDIEYLDSDDVAAVESLEKKTSRKLCISENIDKSGILCKRDILSSLSRDDDVVDLDHDLLDTQACATIACDIYKHLRASEEKKRPSIDFMERVQKDINPSMRAILIDWLVEVAEEYRLVPETLYLTVNYIDRYLSGNVMDRQRLQLLGVACMMIASKYEEICAPQVEEFCYITDNTYFKDEVVEMESAVLNYLKFEMTAPTTKGFLRRFVRAAQGLAAVHDSLQLECLVNFLAELSLLEYSMLCYPPSLIAASAIFLAKYILLPTKRPWNSTLRHYTQYEPSELRDCVLALHGLCCNNHSSSLPAIREKYSQHKYKFVAKKYCPPTIAAEMFEIESSCC